MSDKYTHTREFTRATTALLARVRQGDRDWMGVVRDVSMGGVYLMGTAPLTPRGMCDVEIPLGDGRGDVRIRARGQVIRAEATGMAIQFHEIPLECLEHLQKLVLYNSEDSEKVEAELASHIGLKPRSNGSDAGGER